MEKIYLTFDFDWAPDEIVGELIEFLTKENVKATLFITNQIDSLNHIKKSNLFELAIHPNFTPLPQDAIYHNDFISNAECILRDLFEIVPDATIARSHGLTVNTRILNLMSQYGIKRESNIYIPYHNDLPIKAWYHSNGLIRLPYFFEDDLYCEELLMGRFKGAEWDVLPFLNSKGLKIFNFHPIHFKLNTENMKRYYSYRELEKESFKNPVDSLVNHSDLFGSRVMLQQVIKHSRNMGYEFGFLSEINPEVEIGI